MVVLSSISLDMISLILFVSKNMPLTHLKSELLQDYTILTKTLTRVTRLITLIEVNVFFLKFKNSFHC